MGVYIKGMDMPKSCFAGNGCEFRHICEPFKVALVRPALMRDEEWIAAAKKIAGEMCKKRLEACPLVEVSTPHGRLIDADELEKFELPATLFPKGRESNIDVWTHAVAVGNIQNAPTVIESEE